MYCVLADTRACSNQQQDLGDHADGNRSGTLTSYYPGDHSNRLLTDVEIQ